LGEKPFKLLPKACMLRGFVDLRRERGTSRQDPRVLGLGAEQRRGKAEKFALALNES